MAVVVFSGVVAQQSMRVVDLGVGSTPRLVVEIQIAPDAMGSRGWASVDPIPRATFEALLVAAHVV